MLQAYLRDHADELSAETRARIDLNPLRAFDAKDPGTQRVMDDAPRLARPPRRRRPRALRAGDRRCSRRAGVEWEHDDRLVRGLDYYTRTIFEFTSDALGAQSGVGGGGRYDGLIEQLGGPPTPGCGFAAGVERMLMAAEERPQPEAGCDLFLAWEPSERARRLRARHRGAPRRASPRSWISPGARSRAR